MTDPQATFPGLPLSEVTLYDPLLWEKNYFMVCLMISENNLKYGKNPSTAIKCESQIKKHAGFSSI